MEKNKLKITIIMKSPIVIVLVIHIIISIQKSQHIINHSIKRFSKSIKGLYKNEFNLFETSLKLSPFGSL